MPEMRAAKHRAKRRAMDSYMPLRRSAEPTAIDTFAGNAGALGRYGLCRGQGNADHETAGRTNAPNKRNRTHLMQPQIRSASE